jgi:MOSC domain-containing protein YiiM
LDVFAGMTSFPAEVLHLYVSPGHNYFGHHGMPAGGHPTLEVEEVECVAGRGIRGDRFYDYRADYPGQVTFFAEEFFQFLCESLDIRSKSPDVLRRNIITRGVDLNAWIGTEFELQGVLFRGVQECKPCYWMNGAFGEGAERLLKGNGGLRAEVLSDGLLRRSVLVAA